MQKKKRLYITVIIVSLVIISCAIYYTLGGFDPVEVYAMEGKERTVIGKSYTVHRRVAGSQIREKGAEMREAIVSGELKGQLTFIFYPQDSLSQDSIHYFLGASFDEIQEVLKIPAGYEYKEFQTQKVYKVFLSQHPLVRPLPDEIEQLMSAKAAETGDILQPFTFELYYEDNSLSVEQWGQ